jgi:hypothetical protein
VTPERDLATLPAPAIDPAFSERVQRRARSALRDRGLLPRERAVPALLLVAGAFYAAASVDLMIRVFGG